MYVCVCGYILPNFVAAGVKASAEHGPGKGAVFNTCLCSGPCVGSQLS